MDNCTENIFKMQEKILFYSMLIFLKKRKKKYLLSIYCGPGTIVDAENIAMWGRRRKTKNATLPRLM